MLNNVQLASFSKIRTRNLCSKSAYIFPTETGQFYSTDALLGSKVNPVSLHVNGKGFVAKQSSMHNIVVDMSVASPGHVR